MATTAIVQAKINVDLKDKASAVLAEIGMTVDDALRLLLTQVVEEHDLPLVMHMPNSETVVAMRETEGGTGKPYSSLDDLFRDMRG